MTINSSAVRKYAVSFAGTILVSAILLGSIIEPLVTQTLVDHGFFKKPETFVWSIVIDLFYFVKSRWFYLLTGGVVGFAAGSWLDAFLRNEEVSDPIDVGPSSETMVRFERDRSSPFKWNPIVGKNAQVFQIWNYKPAVMIKEFLNNVPSKIETFIPESFPASHHDSLFNP